MSDEIAEDEELFFPSGFLDGYTSYKIFLYDFLIENSLVASKDFFNLDYVVACMACKAWNCIVEAKLTLGLQDRLGQLCLMVARKFPALPTVSQIENEIKDKVYTFDLNKIRTVFPRFLTKWSNQKYTPYTLFRRNGTYFITINENWKDFCLTHYERCKQIYNESLQSYLVKRNKNVTRVYEFLKESGGFVEDSENSKEDVFVDEISTENIELLSNIPYSFLYESNGFSDCPAVLQLKLSPPDCCRSICDILLAGTYKRRNLEHLSDYIKENQSRIIDLYNYYSTKAEIPNISLPDMPLGLLLQNFVQEYVDRFKRKITLLPKSQQDSRKKRIDAFSFMFDAREEMCLTIDDLAAKCGVSKQRASQILNGEREIGLHSVSKILNGLQESNDFIVNPSLLSALVQLKFDTCHAYPIESFDICYGVVDEKTRNLITKISEWKVLSLRYIGRAMVRGGNSQIIAQAFANARSFFDEKLLPMSIEGELVPHLQDAKIFDNETLDIVCDLIRNSSLFESVDGNNGEKLYSLKWENLLTVPSRLARILYEQGEPMRIKDVYGEYKSRATAAGIPFEDSSDWFINRSHPFIVNIGKTGWWTFSINGQVAKPVKKSARDAIESFVKSQGGKVLFNDVLCFMRENGYHHAENTIRIYLYDICRTVSMAPDTYVYKKWQDRFEDVRFSKEKHYVSSVAISIFIDSITSLGGKATLRDLKDAYKKATGDDIIDNTARRIVKTNSNFSVEYDSSGMIVVSLSDASSSMDETNHDVQESFDGDNYRDRIRRRIIQILKDETSHRKRLSAVFNDVSKLVPKDRRTNIVYRIIQNMKQVETYIVDEKKYIRLK